MPALLLLPLPRTLPLLATLLLLPPPSPSLPPQGETSP
jgi:hypothetical protein